MTATVEASAELARLEARFVALVRGYRQQDPLAPVSVVVGSHLQHIYLRRLLARAFGAVVNVRFFTLLDLAGEIHLAGAGGAGGAGDAPGDARGVASQQVLPDGAQAPLLETILARRWAGGNALAGASAPPPAAGLSQAVAATLRDLREGRIEPDTVGRLPAARPWLAQLASLAAEFDRKIRGFSDRTRLFERAAAAAASQVAAALPVGPVVIYGIYDLNALQLDTIARLPAAAAQSPVTILVPWHPEAEELAFARALVDRLLARGFALDVLDVLDGTEDDTASQRRGERRMFSAADRHGEVEETVRRVLADLDDGVAAADIAILHRLDQLFDETLAAALARAGLSCYRAAGYPVRRSALGRCAINLLRLVYDEPRRATLLELVSLPCVELDWVEPGLRPHPAHWESLSKELGLVKGWDEFRAVLALHLANLGGDDEEDRREWRRERLSGLRAVVDAFAGLAEQAAAALTWSEQSALLVEALERLAPREQGSPAFAAITDRITSLSVLDAARVPCDLVGFRNAAESAVRQAVVSGGYFQRDGVFVGNVMSARLLRFRRVYLLECAERTLPPVIRQDPLLLDEERARLNAVTSAGFLPLKRARLEEERLLFELTCQSAQEQLTLAYARRGSRSATVRLPSALLLDEAGDLAGRFMSAEALEHAADRPPWFVRLPSRFAFHGTGTDDALRALDESDLRLHLLEQGAAASPALETLWPGLGRYRERRTAFGSPRFGPYDGIVPGQMIAALQVLEGQLSASSLADLAVCPYRFFLSKVLGLRAHVEPDDTLEIAPVHRGSVVHRILERFVNAFVTASGESASWRGFAGDAERGLQAIMADEFDALPKGVTGLPLVWRMIQRQLADEVRTYLVDTAQVEAGDNEPEWRPAVTEHWFEDVQLPAGPWQLRVRGRIDRVDRAAGAIRVIDYKTGRQVRERADGYRSGMSLQLPLYLHAVAQQEGVPLDRCRAEFHYVSDRAGYRRVALTGAALNADQRFADVLAAMASVIVSGHFFTRPGKNRENCRFCDFRDLCHSQVETMSQRKEGRSSDLMVDYRHIEEGAKPSDTGAAAAAARQRESEADDG